MSVLILWFSTYHVLPNLCHAPLFRILQEIVADAVEIRRVRVRECRAPAVEVMAAKTKIVPSPKNTNGFVPQDR